MRFDDGLIRFEVVYWGSPDETAVLLLAKNEAEALTKGKARMVGRFGFAAADADAYTVEEV